MILMRFDLGPLLTQVSPLSASSTIVTRDEKVRNEVPPSLDETILKDAKDIFERGEKVQLSYTIRNTDRTVGTRLSAMLARRGNLEALQPDHLTLHLQGYAGQSLGAFAAHGIRIELLGVANDYVGKGLSGGTIIITPPPSSKRQTNRNTIIGNTVLYGATAGILFAAGQAGERFAVRNSGARTVVEGMRR